MQEVLQTATSSLLSGGSTIIILRRIITLITCTGVYGVHAIQTDPHQKDKAQTYILHMVILKETTARVVC